MTALFGPQNANAALVLPTGSTIQRYGTAQTWVQDCSAPGRNDGTVLDAAFYNRIIGNLDYIVSIAGVAAQPGDMSALFRAIMAAVAGSAPGVLDTIAELAAALGSDANFSTTIANALANRVRFDANQSLTLLQRQQVMVNLGLNPIVFSGSYNDLSNLPVLGSAASQDWGILAGQLIRLDNTGKIPALDGSQLTALPLVPTASLGTNTQQIANTAFVAAALAALVNSSPGTLDTLKELADALGDDPNFSTTITTLIGTKLAKAANLSDLASIPTARTNLGLGSAALFNVGTGASQVVQLDGTGKLPAVDGSQLTNVVSTVVLRSYLAGLTLSTSGSSSSFGVAPGIATDANNSLMMALAAALTKTYGPWGLGSTNGALDTGTAAPNTWYHVYLIERTDTGVVEVAISLSASAPTFGAHIPAAYTKYRRIGSMLINGSSVWAGFTQNGDEFLWSTPNSATPDISAPALGTISTLFTLPSVPLGVRVNALLNAIATGTGNFGVLVSSPDQNLIAGGSIGVNLTVLTQSPGGFFGSGQISIRTNAAAQVQAVANAAGITLDAVVVGFVDRRGKDA
jgi:hypothetical protein